ncbi:chromosome partitioning protein ParA [Vibrio hippocampi]|uniref:Chromosome partitioning protein ParA n=1 Tax=Vibrio hippocampi TaxID=654686 RepID=A0ABM8ZH62_9VIBR|nr:chromosome partitioning protein ParA [Vibrio hippocampi]CAH0526032.1 hypothetical protein VHP8226_01516 [Vibrio hippocampi]
MDKQPESRDDQNEELVIIEEKDKKARLYIAIATALSLAAGGLIGAVITKSDWQQRYRLLNTQYQQQLSQTQQHQSELESQKLQIEADEQLKRRKVLDDALQTHQLELDKLQSEIKSLTAKNGALSKQLADKQQTIAVQQEQNNQLERKADMQSSMFGQSQEIFKRETELQSEIAKLNKEKQQLEKDKPKLEKQCNLYLEGTSWDARSDSCDRFDDLTARLSQINQMLQVHNMDLTHINALKQELGL